MDTSDPQIAFDLDGICNHCIEFVNVRARHRFTGEEGERRLLQLADEVKRSGRGRDYDCVVGVSGGVDSTYVTHVLHDLGLRLLAVHLDNGWDSEESVSNIRSLTNRFKINYQSVVLNWEEFRDLQLSFLNASVPEAETPTDVAIVAALHDVAAKYGVKYIVSAGNLTTEGILPKSWHYNAKDLQYLRQIHRRFGKKELREFPTFDYKKEVFYKLIKGMRIVYPMNLVNQPKEGITKFLVDNLDYKPSGGKHYESRYTKFIQSYYLYEKFGIDYRKAKFSSEICCGRLNREEAIARLQTKPYDPAAIQVDMRYVAKKLRLTFEELERIIALPPKWYWDYPNDERKLQFVYGLYLRLFGKEKLSSF